MKYIIFTHGCDGASIAKKLLDEGCEVTLAQFQDKSEYLTGDELKEYKDKEKDDNFKEDERRRLSVYDGIIDKKPAKTVLKAMKDIENKDEYFIWFDLNDFYVVAEKVIAMGFTKGLFPSAEDCDLEDDRAKAKEFVEEHYKDLTVAEEQEFKSAEDGIKFLEETDKIWVLKGNDDQAKTKVPMTNDPEKAKFVLIDLLESHAEEYEKGGFILEEKIVDGYEMTPEIIFWNGEPVCTTVDIENKPKEAGNVGIQLGCAQNLVILTEIDDKINKLAFPKVIYDMAKKHKGLFVFDAGLIFKDGKFYFTEFCANRFGYDSLFTEIDMAGGANNFFENIANGENPIVSKYGSAVRGLNEHKDGEQRRVLEEIPMKIEEEQDPHTFVYEIKKCEDKTVCTGNTWDLVVFTGSGDTVEDATDMAYEAANEFTFDDFAYRPKFDFLSFDYVSSIPNRLQAGIDEGLFEANGVMTDRNLIDERENDRIKKSYDRKMKNLKEEINQIINGN